MSNPTELPDLDRGYFNRKLATIIRDLSSYTAQGMARELVRLAKVADESEAVKEARCAQPERAQFDWMKSERIRDEAHVDEALRNFREDPTGDNATGIIQAALTVWAADVDALAKPEGEAPQAWMRVTDITEWADTEPETDGWTPLFTHAPAAQHAESGAQAALEQAAALVVKMTAPPRDLLGAPTVAMKTTANLGQRIATAIRALTPDLAAQSQGAQPVAMECRRYCKGDAEWTEWRAITAAEYERRKGDSAFEFRPIAAQQAAAPGALDADEMTRLRRLMSALGHADAFELSDEYVRGVLCTVLGLAAGKLERATLAAASISPGTPEAPGLPGQNDQEAYAGSGYRHFMSLDTFKAFRRECENRAAQLDGGQEGSESNG